MSAVLSVASSTSSDAPRSLADLMPGGSGVIVAVRASNEHVSPELLRRLAELGFFPGEHVRVLATGPLGREPIAVRVGTSTFALRKLEAACVQIAAQSVRE